MGMLCNERGKRHAASRNRTTGTTIEIREYGDNPCSVICKDHHTTTMAPKWNAACEVARRPAEWCEGCRTAPPPAPKPKPEPQPKGERKPPPDAEQRAAIRAARLAAEAKEQAAKDKAEAKALPGRIREANRALKTADTAEASAFRKLDRAQPGTDRWQHLYDAWRNASREQANANANLMHLVQRQNTLRRQAERTA